MGITGFIRAFLGGLWVLYGGGGVKSEGLVFLTMVNFTGNNSWYTGGGGYC